MKTRRPPPAEAPPFVMPILLTLVTLAFVLLILDFYKAIVWAFVFALLSFPLYRKLTERFGDRTKTAAAVTTLVVVLVVLLPAIAFAMVLAEQASTVVEDIQEGELDPAAPLQWAADQVPRLDHLMESVGLDISDLSSRLNEAATAAGEFLATQALAIGQGALTTSLLIALTVYLLFFFLCDGRRILHFIETALPIRGPGERYLMTEISSVTQATVKGIIVIGIVQGTLGGIVFAALGISNAVLWGVAMAISTILPVVGTAIIWLPAAIMLFAAGSWIKGLLMIAAGVIIIGLADNLLRPYVVGRDTRMPDYIVLLATLGGLAAFGLTGLVLGPVIAGAFLACWRMFRPEVSLDEAEAQRNDSAADSL